MAANLKEMSNEQLMQSLREKEHALVGMRFKLSMSQLENTATVRTVRKDIARIKTEARRRELDGGLAKDGLLSGTKVVVAASEAASLPAAPERGGFLKGIVDKLTGKE